MGLNGKSNQNVLFNVIPKFLNRRTVGKRSVQCNLLHHYGMSTSDHLSLSSCTVICLWGKISCRIFHCRTRSLVSFVATDGIDHLCQSISNPNFLPQKPFAHGRTESCIKISAFLKSFAVFIFLLQKSGRSDNSGSAVSQTL